MSFYVGSELTHCSSWKDHLVSNMLAAKVCGFGMQHPQKSVRVVYLQAQLGEAETGGSLWFSGQVVSLNQPVADSVRKLALKIQMVCRMIEEDWYHWSLIFTCTTQMCTCIFNHVCMHALQEQGVLWRTYWDPEHTEIKSFQSKSLALPSSWAWFWKGRTS